MNYNLQSEKNYYFNSISFIFNLIIVEHLSSSLGGIMKEEEELLQKFDCSVKIGYILNFVSFHFSF